MSLSGSARNDGTQGTAFIRRRVQVTDTSLATGYKIGRMPSRAFVLQISYHLITVFNSVTSDVIQIGTTAGGTNILAATNVHASPGFVNVTAAAGLGLAVTAGGEVDLFVSWTQVGGGANTGDITIVIAFAPDNDG